MAVQAATPMEAQPLAIINMPVIAVTPLVAIMVMVVLNTQWRSISAKMVVIKVI